MRKNILSGDLFDDDLYLLCAISIFATFEIGGLSRILKNIENTWLSLSTSFTSVFVSLNYESMVKSSTQLLQPFLKYSKNTIGDVRSVVKCINNLGLCIRVHVYNINFQYDLI